MINKFFVLSDIHLEFHPSIKSLSDLFRKFPDLLENDYETSFKLFKEATLILAGDIGYPTRDSFWSFITDCSNNFKNVLFVCGNHEYYNVSGTKPSDAKTLDQIDKHILDKTAELNKTNPNFHYLNKTDITIDGVRFLGTTLWSMIPSNVAASCGLTLNDYYSIYESPNKLLTIPRSNSNHINHVIWLTRALKEDMTTPTIVITHHLPSFKLIHNDYALCKDLNHAYASDIEHLIQPNLKVWFCGHTHKATDTIINNTRFIINPLGYSGQNPDAKLKYLEFDF